MFPTVLVCLGCYNKKAIDRAAYKQQKFISPSSGCWKSKISVAWWDKGSLLVEEFWLYLHMVEGARGLCDFCFERTNPFMRAPPS